MKNPLFKDDNSARYICTKVNKQNNRSSDESVTDYNYHTDGILTKHLRVVRVKHFFNGLKTVYSTYIVLLIKSEL